MNTFRPQDYVIAVLYIIAMIGPVLAGLCCHVIAAGFIEAWGLIHG